MPTEPTPCPPYLLTAKPVRYSGHNPCSGLVSHRVVQIFAVAERPAASRQPLLTGGAVNRQRDHAAHDTRPGLRWRRVPDQRLRLDAKQCLCPGGSGR
jgi:hypothetical protein